MTEWSQGFFVGAGYIVMMFIGMVMGWNMRGDHERRKG